MGDGWFNYFRVLYYQMGFLNLRSIGCLAIVLLLSGCHLMDYFDTNQSVRAPNGAPMKHRVVRGETLFSIAFRYERDYHQLATENHIAPPYTIKVGQWIWIKRLYSNPPAFKTRPRPQPLVQISPTTKSRYGWIAPVYGPIVSSFSPTEGRKGLDIAGRRGDVVRAASNGIVAYAGSGLAGYGNLIIIRHQNQVLTAYGHNLKNRVREGQSVKVGQTIADIGLVDRRYWGVHFEIRERGQPVNPRRYLG
jgi:lipoprotein NlpD